MLEVLTEMLVFWKIDFCFAGKPEASKSTATGEAKNEIKNSSSTAGANEPPKDEKSEVQNGKGSKGIDLVKLLTSGNFDVKISDLQRHCIMIPIFVLLKTQRREGMGVLTKKGSFVGFYHWRHI